MATRLSKKAIILIVAAAVILPLSLLTVPDSSARVDALAPVYQVIHYLNDLVDVNASSPADNEALTWDAATGMWIPETIGGGGFTCTNLNSCSLNNIGDVDIPSSIYGYIIYWDGTAWKAKAEDTFSCSDLNSCNFTELGDVDIASPTNGYFVYWNSTDSKWRAKAVEEFGCDDLGSCNISELNDVNATSPSDGKALIWDESEGKWVDEEQYASITYVIDGGGSAITTGEKGHLEIPFKCNITQATLLADQSGSMVIDVWNDDFASFPPTDADSITASSPPTISSAQASRDTTLTNWNKTINANDILAFNVDSCSNITRITLSLKVLKAGSRQTSIVASGQVGLPPPMSPGPGAHLDGNVGLTGFGRVNLVVRFFTPNTDTEIFKACAPTDANGNFTIYGIPAGTYDVGVKSDNSKSILVEDKVFTDGNTTDIDFGNLLRGDLNQDDAVISTDYSILSGQFNTLGDCYGYAGDWLMPECPEIEAEGATYGYIIE